MEVTDRHYPYPVLGGKADAFAPECHFDVTCEMSYNPKTIRAQIDVDLLEDEISRRILTGDAKLIAHIECPCTAFRDVRDLNLQGSTELHLSHGQVTGEIQICVFVVAVKPLPRYTSKSFKGFYAGRLFDVEIGGRLAVAPHFKFSIATRDKRFSNSQSLIVYSPDTNEDSKGIRVETNQDQIVIFAPPKQMGVVQLMNQDYRTISALAKKNYLFVRAMVTVPALVEVLGRLARCGTDASGRRDLSEFSDCKWFAYLNAKVVDYMARHGREHEKTNDLYDIDFNLYHTLSIAQFIAEDPFVWAFDRLKSIA